MFFTQGYFSIVVNFQPVEMTVLEPGQSQGKANA